MGMEMELELEVVVVVELVEEMELELVPELPSRMTSGPQLNRSNSNNCT